MLFAMTKLYLAYIGCHRELSAITIIVFCFLYFFSTVIYYVLGKHRETNWELVSNCQEKQYCRTLHLSRVDGVNYVRISSFNIFIGQ